MELSKSDLLQKIQRLRQAGGLPRGDRYIVAMKFPPQIQVRAPGGDYRASVWDLMSPCGSRVAV